MELSIHIFEMYMVEIAKEFEDTKEVIRILISKKNRQHNGQTMIYKTYI
jgi:hypothetical protein